jgi:hypothetical protein
VTVRQITQYVVVCDACGRELGQGYGHREAYDTPHEADTAARVAGWHPHPDSTHYCQEGQHQ